MERSPAAAPQLASRARRRVREAAPAPVETRGADAVARQALGYAALDLTFHPILVNGVVGVAVTQDGRPFSLGALTVVDGRIVAMDLLADPDRLDLLDPAIWAT